MSKSFIENIAQKLRIIPNIDKKPHKGADQQLRKYPNFQDWDNHTELDAQAWPKQIEKNYSLVPTSCFNCESACGLLAYVDKDSGEVTKFEGNTLHPGSRGRNCAKGPATINQIKDTERILYPLKRVGKRGEGGWERVSWDEVLDDIASKIRASLQTGARDRVVYHVGRPCLLYTSPSPRD